MRLLHALLALPLVLALGGAANDPGTYVDTPGGRMAGAAQFYWNGTAWVADGPAGGSTRTLVTLSVKTVTTGGAAVTAIAVGGRTAGGWIQNPPSATINLCINEIGTATGTTSSGDTTCIVPGQSYNVAPAAGAVSVISSDSAHPFSGYSFQ